MATRRREDDMSEAPTDASQNGEQPNADGAPTAGDLPPEYLQLVMRHLPMSVAVLDDHDTLIYWRGPRFAYCDVGWIDRDVRDCHTPAQNEAIARIIAAFRDEKCDEATFWKRHGGRLFLHRYTAMRDEGGKYRGFLSTLEDVTDVVGLTGEESALDWQAP
jgi:uncharacterized protein